jgi:glycine cleavage system transcriptional repressor
MTSFVLSAVGRDRPGIVAEIARVLLTHGVNIEDAEMANLRGHFAVMLVLEAPDDVDAEALRRDLAEAERDLPLEAAALAEVERAESPAPSPSHAISVYGADHPGIVYGVTRALAGRGVNIVGLTTRVVGEKEGEPVYVMLLDVALPPALDDEALAALLRDVALRESVDVSARRADADVL